MIENLDDIPRHLNFNPPRSDLLRFRNLSASSEFLLHMKRILYPIPIIRRKKESMTTLRRAL